MKVTMPVPAPGCSPRQSQRSPGSFRRAGVGLLGVAVLLGLAAPRADARRPERADPAAGWIRALDTPQGKVHYLFSINPGGPVFDFSAPMKKLVKQGTRIEPRLLPKLKDARIRNEVALILAEMGDQAALPALIEGLPKKKELTADERFTTMCFLYALWQLTGMELGISHKWSPAYTPEFRAQWQSWYRANKDYLYTPTKPRQTVYGWGRDHVLVDIEARLAHTPTKVYRKAHPWIAYDEIKHWRDDAAYQHKLKDLCFSIIVSLAWRPYGHRPSEAIVALGHLHEPRALAALHALCGMGDDPLANYELIGALQQRGDPSSIPFLQLIPATKTIGEDSIEETRRAAIKHILLLQRYGKELQGKRFDWEQQWWYLQCKTDKGLQKLIAEIRQLDDFSLWSDLQVAGTIHDPRLRSCLEDMIRTRSRSARAKTMLYAALGKLGDKDAVAHLKKALAHKQPGVRLAAAEGLWYLGRRDGFQTLVDITSLRPIETGHESVQPNGDVVAINGTNVEFIREACKILGEMGDRRAIKPLQSLLPLNLNGNLQMGGSGTGWYGRPDVVALARLGDFSGIGVLRASIRREDPLGAVGSWGGDGGDYVEIGRKRFIPDILPMLDNRDESKRVLAAQAILMLLKRGK